MAGGLRSGFVYFAITFAIGFLLGAVRTLWVAPRLGATLAVSAEVPLMLAASWLVCGWVIRRLRPGGGWRVRTVMGASAFILLQAAELSLAVFGFGRSPGDYVAGFGSAAGAIGLSIQVVFAILPLVRRGLARP